MRDYGDVVRRIEGLPQAYVGRRVLAEVEGYPILGVTLSLDPTLPVMFVTGGTHGDEPAGIEGALAFLEEDHSRWLRCLQFEVIPCLNAYGYVHNTRHNAQDIDINWAFLRDDVPEVEIVRRAVDSRRFEAILDLHEDWESPGFYLYEQVRERPPIGWEIAEQVSAVVPLNTNPCIEGTAAQNGVIHPDLTSERRRKGEGIPIALFQQHTDHLITSETPTCAPLERRVQAQLIVLKAMAGAHCTVCEEA